MDGEELLQLLYLLHKSLGELKDGATASLVRGVDDFGKYQNLAGYIRGLQTSQAELEDLLKKVKERIGAN